MNKPLRSIKDVHPDSREGNILKLVVETFFKQGEPVGSHKLADLYTEEFGKLSPASIRNAMQELEYLGLLDAPHTSAGRQPTDLGLRFYIDHLAKVGPIDEETQKILKEQVSSGQNITTLLEDITGTLADLTKCASMAVLPQGGNPPLKHVQFLNLSDKRVLTILVSKSGKTENRISQMESDIPPSVLEMASNFINAHIKGKTLAQLREFILKEISVGQEALQQISQRLVNEGLAVWSGGDNTGFLIMRGQATLLKGATLQDIERIRGLFETIDDRKTALGLVEAASHASGVQMFIGSENHLFPGCSMVMSPILQKEGVVGVMGMLGPRYMNIPHVLPMVDYTTKLLRAKLG